MAQVTQIELVDDLDGGPADETVPLALDGKNYEIDLSEANARKLRDSLAPFIAAARRPGGRRSTPAGRPASGGRSRDENQKIRAWLQQHGHQVANRGRISTNLIEAYRKATAAGV